MPPTTARHAVDQTLGARMCRRPILIKPAGFPVRSSFRRSNNGLMKGSFRLIRAHRRRRRYGTARLREIRAARTPAFERSSDMHGLVSALTRAAKCRISRADTLVAL